MVAALFKMHDMTTVQDLLDQVLKVDVSFESQESINDTRATVISLQTEQLLMGERSDLSKIGMYKSADYARKKHALNPLAGEGFMDWKLTGSLHKELYVDVREDIYIIDSANEKTEGLVKRLGDPFGLNVQSQDRWVDETLEETVINRFRKVLDL